MKEQDETPEKLSEMETGILLENKKNKLDV